MNNFQDKTLVLAPHRLFSLWDMNQIIAKNFLAAWTLVEHEFTKAERADKRQFATDSERTALDHALCEFQHQCYYLGLQQSNDCCNRFLDQLRDPGWHHDAPARQAAIQGLPRPPWPKEIPLPSFETIYTQLRTLIEITGREMATIRLAVISSENAQYFEHDELFGQAVKDSASPQLNAEIKAAGNCLAAGLHTAAVFHLMRVVEFGLRGLARDLQVPIPDEDLEYKQWHIIIDLIRAEVKKKTVCSSLPDKEKSETREFYNGLLAEFEGFKDVWRNDVMHTRRSYTANEAVAVLEHVRPFMQRLAPRVPLG